MPQELTCGLTFGLSNTESCIPRLTALVIYVTDLSTNNLMIVIELGYLLTTCMNYLS